MQMHQMMDAMHGAGASQRMHEAMGAAAEQQMDQCAAMMNMMTSGGMMGLGWLMMLIPLLLILGLVLLVVWLIRRPVEPTSASDTEPPLRILQRRYARGEIGREDYEQLRADLLRADSGHV